MYLKEHVNSIKRHVEQLGEKNYHDLYQIESPDFVLLFIPIEPAFAIALNEDTLLYNIDLTAELKEQIKYWSDYQLVWVQKEIARSIQAIEANANLKLIIEAMLIKVIDELQRR